MYGKCVNRGKAYTQRRTISCDLKLHTFLTKGTSCAQLTRLPEKKGSSKTRHPYREEMHVLPANAFD